MAEHGVEKIYHLSDRLDTECKNLIYLIRPKYGNTLYFPHIFLGSILWNLWRIISGHIGELSKGKSMPSSSYRVALWSQRGILRRKVCTKRLLSASIASIWFLSITTYYHWSLRNHSKSAILFVSPWVIFSHPPFFFWIFFPIIFRMATEHHCIMWPVRSWKSNQFLESSLISRLKAPALKYEASNVATN